MSATEAPPPRGVKLVPDWAAVENARLLNRARAALLRSGTAVTIGAIADATGKQPHTVRRWVGRLRDAGRLVAVTHDRRLYVPTVQLSPNFDDVDPDVAAIVGRLVACGMGGWAVWDWFQTPNGWLDGDTPAGRLATSDVAAVQRAVSSLLQE